MRVMAIGAHPDDVEFMCAGTLFLLKRQENFEFQVTTLTAGDCGSVEHPPDEIADIRRGEAREAAGMLDADYSCLEEKDCRIFTGSELLETVVEQMRRFAPHVVFTHYPEDYMVDHEETSRIVRSATFTAPIPNFSTGADDPAQAMDHIPHLYYWAPMEGKNIFGKQVESGFYVDIGGVIEQKKQMLACHASQREWLLKQHGVDEYINAMVETAHKTGLLASVPYAEGFTQHRGHAYPAHNVLKEYLEVIE